MRYQIVKLIFLIGLSLLIAYVSWLLYKSSNSWNFFIAFMGGAVAMAVNMAMDRYFRQTHNKDDSYKELRNQKKER